MLSGKDGAGDSQIGSHLAQSCFHPMSRARLWHFLKPRDLSFKAFSLRPQSYVLAANLTRYAVYSER